MFSWIAILALSALSLFDLFVLVTASKGVGVLIVAIFQICTGLLGWFKIKSLDFGLYFYLDTELKKGTRIIRELWEESLVLTGTFLLIIPGFLTDTIGLAFLTPYFRRLCLDTIEKN